MLKTSASSNIVKMATAQTKSAQKKAIPTVARLPSNARRMGKKFQVDKYVGVYDGKAQIEFGDIPPGYAPEGIYHMVAFGPYDSNRPNSQCIMVLCYSAKGHYRLRFRALRSADSGLGALIPSIRYRAKSKEPSERAEFSRLMNLLGVAQGGRS